MKCEILVTKEDGQVSAGTVTLDSGKVTVQPEKGYAILMENVLESRHVVNDELVTLKEDSKAWFDSLPSHYNGSRLRARML